MNDEVPVEKQRLVPKTAIPLGLLKNSVSWANTPLLRFLGGIAVFGMRRRFFAENSSFNAELQLYVSFLGKGVRWAETWGPICWV